MEIISTTGADLLALRKATALSIKRYKSSDRSELVIFSKKHLRARRTLVRASLSKIKHKKKHLKRDACLNLGRTMRLEEEIISGGDYFNDRRRFVSFEKSDRAFDKALQIK